MSIKGSLLRIFITPNEDGKITEVSDIEAVAGIGMKGDRNYTFQINKPRAKRRA